MKNNQISKIDRKRRDYSIEQLNLANAKNVSKTTQLSQFVVWLYDLVFYLVNNYSEIF